MTVLDASALLAFLLDEPGSEVVEQLLESGATCSAANWSETAQKVRRAGADWSLARGLLLDYVLVIEPVLLVDAERAAEMWAERSSLSLGDRLCLALADRLETEVWTADAAWGSAGRVRQLRPTRPRS